MLLIPYQQIKQRLDGIAGVRLLQWFNNQYEGTIHAVPAVFIEFLNELKFETVRRDVQQAEMKVRIHAVSKVLSAQDGSIPEAQIEAHEAICDEIYFRLQGFRSAPDASGFLLFNSMMRTAYRHHHYNLGWMLVTQDFDCMIYQNERTQGTALVAPEIKINI
jgi:hypothetical protein